MTESGAGGMSVSTSLLEICERRTRRIGLSDSSDWEWERQQQFRLCHHSSSCSCSSSALGSGLSPVTCLGGFALAAGFPPSWKFRMKCGVGRLNRLQTATLFRRGLDKQGLSEPLLERGIA